MHPAELIDSLEMSASVLERFVGRIPEDKLHRERGEGIWTVYEHLHHLVLVQPMLFKRLRSFKNEEKPVIRAYVPDENEATERKQKRSVDELITAFKDWRAKQVELIRSCGPEVWLRTGTHSEYDLYTFEILVRHVLTHDGWHMYRMEEIWLVKDGALTK
ncbi:DinB family protein [bacterium]|nr:DinB family protein [bacterium]